MEKYGTYVIFQNVSDPDTEVNIPLDSTDLIEEMEKSAEWKRKDSDDGEKKI